MVKLSYGCSALGSSPFMKLNMNEVINAAREKLECLPQDNFVFHILNTLLEHAPTDQGHHVIADNIVHTSGWVCVGNWIVTYSADSDRTTIFDTVPGL